MERQPFIANSSSRRQLLNRVCAWFWDGIQAYDNYATIGPDLESVFLER